MIASLIAGNIKIVKTLVLLLFFISVTAVAKSLDYKNLPFLDENIKVGLGLTYSKLENSSDVGNYFLLSQANPRLEMQYDSPIRDQYTNRFLIYAEQLVYRPENNMLGLKYTQPFLSYGISWRPRWISNNEGFAYGYKLAGKSAAVISELPNPYYIYGDIATRFSAEAGVSVVWFGQTVAKLPLSIDFELLYSYFMSHFFLN